MVSPERQQGAGTTRPGRIPHARRRRREYRTDVSFVNCRFAGPRKPLKISPPSLYTFKDDPAAAHRTAREIYERAGALKTFPHRGRQGRVKGTRELPLPPLPFIVVYRTLSNAEKSPNSSMAPDAGHNRTIRVASKQGRHGSCDYGQRWAPWMMLAI